ncbi:MAG: hypothetical protein V2A77_05055 [Pseudomonadota bacterium]
MPIANYTTTVPAQNSVNEIQRLLVAHHAKSVMVDYEGQEPVGLAFLIPTKNGDEVSFRLPANIAACQKVLDRQVRTTITRERAARVGWRILRDWVRAQMAILETEMVTLEEVMLPYMRIGGTGTLYQVLQERQFKLLPGEGGTTREGQQP